MRTLPVQKDRFLDGFLGLRWRQENSFKFLSQHYAIDQIVQYGAHPETQDRLVPNPKRKALQQQVRACRQRIEASKRSWAERWRAMRSVVAPRCAA